mmetsp:Transcript_39503/g.87888  ORF Transcript_39503/g.87888 Transcript_39503/m.87888 type:complete len:268 (+) Transcript_39503:422-1225(+)
MQLCFGRGGGSSSHCRSCCPCCWGLPVCFLLRAVRRLVSGCCGCRGACWGPVHGVVLCAHHDADALGLPLAEHKARVGHQVLGALDEAEAHACAVSGSQPLTVHGHHPGSLAHNLTVDDGLVAGLDGGGVRQDRDVRIKLPAGLGLDALVHQHHALAHLIPFDLLERQCRGLPRHHLLYRQPLVVDGLDGNWLEGAIRNVGAHEQRHVWRDDAALDSACHHSPHTRHAKRLVHHELGQVALPLHPTLALRDEVVEEADQLQALACDG